MPRTKTIADIEQELAEKRKALQDLQAERKRLVSKLADIDGKIAKLQGRPQQEKPAAEPRQPRRRARRRRKWANLADALADVLMGHDGVKARDAAQMVQDAGYATTSKTFGATVSRTLATDPRFRRVSRGVYVVDVAKSP
jgi:uncharacterized coiled-coil protein SlyX